MPRKGNASPKPRPAKRSSACSTGNSNAAPIAAAMNGPVHGVATTAANTPVQNEPPMPPCRVRAPPAPMLPISNSPARLAVTATISNSSSITIAGSCNWNAQPTSCPPARSASNMPPSARQLTKTPDVYASASRLASASPPLILARLNAFSPRIGKTQGIRLSSSPPSTEKPRIQPKLIVVCKFSCAPLTPKTGIGEPPVGMAPGIALTIKPCPSPMRNTPSMG